MTFSKKVRFKLEWLFLATLTKLVPSVPARLAHSVAKGLGNLAYRFDRRGRTIALENLNFVFGKEKSQAEIEEIARESYRSFARTVTDQLRSSCLNSDNYLDHIELVVEDESALEEARETGAIWVTPHYSNFEWIALITGFRGYRFIVVAQDFKNEALTDLYKKNREVSGHTVISQKNALLKLLRALKNQGHAAFLTDLTIRPSKAATVIECFGKKTCVTTIHAELQKRTGLPVIPGICSPLPDGRYRMRAYRPLRFGPNDTEQSIAQACWDAFEKVIREDPAPWLWMYKHWRYLPSQEATADYPSYARPSAVFEEMVLKERSTAKKSEGMS